MMGERAVIPVARPGPAMSVDFFVSAFTAAAGTGASVNIRIRLAAARSHAERPANAAEEVGLELF